MLCFGSVLGTTLIHFRPPVQYIYQQSVILLKENVREPKIVECSSSETKNNENNSACTVYFRGFEEDITNEELERLFSRYGTIVKCFVHKTRTYGMVEFEQPSSCAEAISDLNNKPPLNLYLNMAKTQTGDRSHSNMGENRRPPPPKAQNTYSANHFVPTSPSYNEEEVYIDENNCIINHLKDAETNEIYVPIRYAPNIRRFMKKTPIVSNGYQDNAALDDDDDTSSVTNANRTVNIDSSNDIKIQRSYTENNERSSRGFQRNPKPYPRSHSGPRNQENRTGDISRPNRYNQNKKNYGDNQQPKFPKKDFDTKKDEGDWNASAQAAEGPSTSTNNSFTYNKPPFKSTPNKEVVSPAVAEEKPTFKTLPKPKTVSYKAIELPKNQFTEVQVETVENETTGWVQICGKSAELHDFMVDMTTEKVTSNPKDTDAEVDKLCLAHFEDLWFRAVVLSVTPKIKVRFIDYGNTAEVESVLELSQKFQEPPAYAICIHLVDGAPCKITLNGTLKVKPVGINNDVVDVQVENGIYGQETPKSSRPATNIASSVSAPPKIISLDECQNATLTALKPNMKGSISITQKISDTQAIAFLLPDVLTEGLIQLDQISIELEADNSSFKSPPKVGDLVAAENEGWNRAFILSIKDGFKVAFIDFGTTMTVPEVKPLPSGFKNIPQFSCKLTTSTPVELSLESLCFEITNILNKTVHCQFEENEVDFTFVLWTPETSLNTAFSLAPEEMKLKNGSDVKIVEELDGFLFLRTRECSEVMKRVYKYIEKYAPNAAKLSKPPEVGDYVAAQFENSWYRAVVKTLKPNNAAEIQFIDYGNVEIKPFLSLKVLDEQCLAEPHSLIKVKLRNFVDKSFSNKNRTYFANMTETNQILKATFNDSVENGIDLTTKEGKNVNEELTKMNAPAPFQGRKELYMKVKAPGKDDPRIMGIKVEEIPLGKGEVKFLTDVNLALHTICICVTNPETLHKIHVELLSQMTKYVQHIAPKEPYIPLNEELILVENGGKWYRALCIKETGEEFTVFIIDYGATLDDVTSDRIKKMPKEFYEGYNALANFAILEGLPDNPSEQLMDRIQSLLLKNEIYKVDVLSKDEDDNYYVVFVDLLKKLKEENLL